MVVEGRLDNTPLGATNRRLLTPSVSPKTIRLGQFGALQHPEGTGMLQGPLSETRVRAFLKLFSANQDLSCWSP